MGVERLPVKRLGRVLRIPISTGFAVGEINTYVILPENSEMGPVLIDTGVSTDAAWSALGAGLLEYGFEIADLDLILLTHGHPDHFGQAARIRREAGCEVWMHEAGDRTLQRYTHELEGEALDVVRLHMRAWGVPEVRTADVRGSEFARNVVEPLVPDRWLRDGEILDLSGSRIHVIHTPGHCPDQVVFLDPQERIAFSGDHLLPDITPVCLLQIPERASEIRISSLVQFQESIAKVKSMDAQLVFPSHGDVIEDHRALITSYRNHIEKRKTRIVHALEEQPMTAFELGQSLFGSAVEDQLFLVLSEIVGHLDLLLAEGAVEVDSEAATLVFRNAMSFGALDRPGSM